MDIFPTLFPLEKTAISLAVNQIIRTNDKSLRYGLTLSPQDALQLVETRNETLLALGRIEVGSATIGKIIEAFCDSAYIQQEEYSSTLQELIEIFFYAKNETLDLLSDDELIELMKDYFEHRCRGSLELLKHREMELLARKVRFGCKDYANLDDCLDEGDEE